MKKESYRQDNIVNIDKLDFECTTVQIFPQLLNCFLVAILQ